MNKLYRIETRKNYGDFYVVAKDPTEAEKRVLLFIDKAGYSRTDVIKINLLSTEVHEFPQGKPHLSAEYDRLILPETCQNL